MDQRIRRLERSPVDLRHKPLDQDFAASEPRHLGLPARRWMCLHPQELRRICQFPIEPAFCQPGIFVESSNSLRQRLRRSSSHRQPQDSGKHHLAHVARHPQQVILTLHAQVTPESAHGVAASRILCLADRLPRDYHWALYS
jgi:hypothetical protein